MKVKIDTVWAMLGMILPASLISGCVPLAIAGTVILSNSRKDLLRIYDANSDRKLEYAEGLTLVSDLRMFAQEEKLNMDDLQLRPDSEIKIQVFPLDARGKLAKRKNEKGKLYDVQVSHKEQSVDVLYFGASLTPALPSFVKWLKARGQVPPAKQ